MDTRVGLPPACPVLPAKEIGACPVLTPFFLRFDSSNGDVFGASGSTVAANPDVRNRFLAEALPAKTFAAGANRLKTLGAASNYNMDDHKPSGWPEQRDEDTRWHHSDWRDVAYFYTYEVVDFMVNNASLR